MDNAKKPMRKIPCNALDLTGQSFGRLRVTGRSDVRGRWVCICSCGNERTIPTASLRHGNTKSCGCLQRESLGLRRKHGESERGRVTPEFKAWLNIKQRCENPHERSHRNYGARGVYICARWRGSFGAFLSDVGRRPTDGHSIDRIDNEGSYTCGACAQCTERGAPMNCKWSTLSEQNCNRRGNRKVTAHGETLTIAEWSRKTGVPHETITARLRRGASGEEAIEQRPADGRRGRKCPRRALPAPA